MLKPNPVFLMLFIFIVSPVFGAYERNVAMPVENVVYGQVKSVRQVTEEQLIEDKSRGWRTFGGALLGGVIGHQFGGGSGNDVATVLGSLLGAAVAANQGGDVLVTQHLVELLILDEQGQRLMVLQETDPAVRFQVGDEVRLVYFTGYVRVDPAL
ncbi:MAG: glycine zipper 2TM domain-containing protein [Shewanella sp.]|nr:glycine zipper 2TM domain-containing protein [Shewanella sp.]MCF1430653.1 glycine zipper 2TM domain-containing protein [Shewanella sp.]MCF1439111.1 glycine zipper 2TM domain-containing protein [Shewanella sp.]MCF1456962.1 glycine zipper 2TM domain-containing protein [Shewanella sp.]